MTKLLQQIFMESLLKAVCYHPSNLRGGGGGGVGGVCVCQGYFVWLEAVARWWFGSYTSVCSLLSCVT